MAILNKGQTFSDGEQVTSAKLNTAVDGATFASGAVDDVSTQLSGGAIIVKDGGVTTAKIADSNVTTAKIADDAVTPAKLSAGAPTWDGSGVHTLPSNGTNGGVGLELNYGVSGNGPAFIDFHSTDASYPDNDARIIKNSGNNSDFFFENVGTGSTVFYQNSAERVRIDSNGRLLVGTTGDDPNALMFLNADGFNASTTGYSIGSKVNSTSSRSHVYFWNPNGAVGNISTLGNSTFFNTSSDYRLKEDIIEMDNSLERLKALKPCNFRWKSDGTRVDGFIAHEAQEVVPEAVTGTKDAVDDKGSPEYQGIDQSKLVPLLTKALQEAVAKIESLEERVAVLES